MTDPGPDSSGRIFISYRQKDDAYAAGWLFDRLSERFGRPNVFKDVDSIPLGGDFVDVITDAVGSCDVLLAVIGPNWHRASGRGRVKRLDDPTDFVRLEIEAALERNVLLIPILVSNALMPDADQLPSSIAPIVRRQALELSPKRFDADTSRLLDEIEKTLDAIRIEKKQAEEERQAELERTAELDRQAELERRAELDRQREQKKAELKRRAELEKNEKEAYRNPEPQTETERPERSRAIPWVPIVLALTILAIVIGVGWWSVREVQSSDQKATEREATASVPATESPSDDASRSACWDGSSASSVKPCPALQGEAALVWAAGLDQDALECEYPYQPEATWEEAMTCGWGGDRRIDQGFVVVARWKNHEFGLRRLEKSLQEAGFDRGRLRVDGDDVGTLLTRKPGLESGTDHTYLKREVLLYDVIPISISIGARGPANDHELAARFDEVRNRVAARNQEEIERAATP